MPFHPELCLFHLVSAAVPARTWPRGDPLLSSSKYGVQELGNGAHTEVFLATQDGAFGLSIIHIPDMLRGQMVTNMIAKQSEVVVPSSSRCFLFYNAKWRDIKECLSKTLCSPNDLSFP